MSHLCSCSLLNWLLDNESNSTRQFCQMMCWSLSLVDVASMSHLSLSNFLSDLVCIWLINASCSWLSLFNLSPSFEWRSLTACMLDFARVCSTMNYSSASAYLCHRPWHDGGKHRCTTYYSGNPTWNKPTPQFGLISWISRNIPVGSLQIYYITRTGVKDESSSMVSLYIDSSTACGYFLSWGGMPPQHCDHCIWDRVGFYTMHTFLNPSVDGHFKSF